jgi:hypothetical protein
MGKSAKVGKQAAMSDSGMIQWVTAAAVIATLTTPAGAADLLPPSSERHLRHRPLGHLPVVPPIICLVPRPAYQVASVPTPQLQDGD